VVPSRLISGRLVISSQSVLRKLRVVRQDKKKKYQKISKTIWQIFLLLALLIRLISRHAEDDEGRRKGKG
jgi:hypothetical protein